MDAGLQRGQMPIPNYTQYGLYGTVYKEKHHEYENFSCVHLSNCMYKLGHCHGGVHYKPHCIGYVIIEARNFPTDCFQEAP